MLAILVAFGAALFIWFHKDPTPTPAESACHDPEPIVETTENAPFDFARQVFAGNTPNAGDVQ